MIKEIIMQWEANKHKLENWFRTSKRSMCRNYSDIVKAIFTYVIEDYSPDEIHVIDDGDWQGTQLFLIHRDTYQPEVKDYLITDTYYGSCAGCDALKNIIDRGERDDINEEQVKELMTLALHLVQKLRPIDYKEI